MNRIRLMPDALASQVAAGEVVERPASVVKELVENSIDAEAKKIEIRVRSGGKSQIQVVDDGFGMNRDDALMSLERHATSKLKKTEDLDGIATLGFRGEAVPSIASVSKFRITTREKDALSGTEIFINGGKLIDVKDSGEAPGTQVDVRSLFFNIPARRKFLRTENTEFSHLEQQVKVQAIANPDVGFTLIRNDRMQFQLPPSSTLLERIQGLAGRDIATRLLEVEDKSYGDVRIYGYIGGFGMGRSNRSLQLVFLNGRPVDAPILNYALREGFHTALMKGQYPITFLFLEMSPFGVDVNVHPAKKEVRFRDGNGVRDAVIDAVSTTLSREQTTIPGQQVRQFPPQAPIDPSGPIEQQPTLIPEREQVALRTDWAEIPKAKPTSPEDIAKAEVKNEGDSRPTREPEPIFGDPGDDRETETVPPAAETSSAPAPQIEEEDEKVKPEDFRIIGVLNKLYVLMESVEGLVLMDQHAAHERVLFEKMRERMANEGVPTQKLLMPLMVELSPRDFDLVQQNLEAIQMLGIGVEPFGANTIKIDALPTFFKTDDPNTFMSGVLEELKRASRKMSSMRLGEDMVATTVCRYAVKANDDLRMPELDKLLDDLLKCELPYCCPHGRPTLIQMSFDELEKKFGRTV